MSLSSVCGGVLSMKKSICMPMNLLLKPEAGLVATLSFTIRSENTRP